jgi:hypothetical protein
VRDVKLKFRFADQIWLAGDSGPKIPAVWWKAAMLAEHTAQKCVRGNEITSVAFEQKFVTAHAFIQRQYCPALSFDPPKPGIPGVRSGPSEGRSCRGWPDEPVERILLDSAWGCELPTNPSSDMARLHRQGNCWAASIPDFDAQSRTFVG